MASWMAWICSLSFVVWFGLCLIPMKDPQEIVYGVPPLLAELLRITPALVALTAGLLGCTILAWGGRYWSLLGRLHYTCVLLSSIGLLWFLFHWNLLPVQA